MAVDKIKPFNDARVQLRSAVLNGITYGYLYSVPPPSVSRRGAVVLVHGFPDISFGWRYQIPFLTSLGLTVIAPDCVGYGRTDSPLHTLSDYGYKRASDDIATLCKQLGLTKILLGGHDWGSAVAWRLTQYYPDLVTGLFTFCTPYFAPSLRYEPLANIVHNYMPHQGYQLQMISGDIENNIQSRSEIRALLNAILSSLNSTRPDHGEGFDMKTGVNLDQVLSHPLPVSGLLTSEELDFYASEFARNGMRGPCNWYRTREVNWSDEFAYFFNYGKALKPDLRINGRHEVLFIRATNDPAITSDMVARMPPKVDKLTYHELESGHWILWEKPAEVNRILEQWLKEKIFDNGVVLSKL